MRIDVACSMRSTAMATSMSSGQASQGSESV